MTRLYFWTHSLQFKDPTAAKIFGMHLSKLQPNALACFNNDSQLRNQDLLKPIGAIAASMITAISMPSAPYIVRWLSRTSHRNTISLLSINSVKDFSPNILNTDCPASRYRIFMQQPTRPKCRTTNEVLLKHRNVRKWVATTSS